MTQEQVDLSLFLIFFFGGLFSFVAVLAIVAIIADSKRGPFE